MNIIKNFLALTGALSLGTSSTAIVLSCGPTNNELEILMQQNMNNSELNFFIHKLGPLIQKELEEKGFNKKVVVNTAKNYDLAAASLSSGITAISWLPVLAYYEHSIKYNINSFHGLLASTATAIKAEYQTSIGDNKEEKIKQMNKNGSIIDTNQDQTNIYKIVLDSAKRDTFDEIMTNNDDLIGSSYYRGYMYVSKVSFREYFENGKNSLDINLKRAWNNLVVPDENEPRYAIFNSNKLNGEPTEQDLQDYWRIVWDVYEQASKDKGIGLSSNKSSGAGRVNPIWTMMETYILANGKSAKNESDIIEAQSAVLKLLDNNFLTFDNYASDISHDLMHGKDNTNRISLGIGWGNSTASYEKVGSYTPEEVMKELMPLTMSHGIFNDGVLYSEKYFKNNFNLLRAVQDTIINLIIDNQEVKDFFNNDALTLGYDPIKIDEDGSGVKEYEARIREYYQNPFIDKATNISETINPKP